MAKATVEGYNRIDIRKWERDGVLTPGTRNWYWVKDGETISSISVETQLSRVVLRYKARESGGNWAPIEDSISLDLTTSALGRERLWFLCPGCGRRVAILFGGKYFRCRRCLGLVYKSQQVSPPERALSRIQRNRTKLGGIPSLLASFPPKPRYMRWSKYFRMMEEDKKVVSQYFDELEISFAFDYLVAQEKG